MHCENDIEENTSQQTGSTIPMMKVSFANNVVVVGEVDLRGCAGTESEDGMLRGA